MTGTTPAILVVNADAIDRAAVAAALREAGFAVAAVGTRAEAGTAVRRDDFAAAVIAIPPQDRAEFSDFDEWGVPTVILANAGALPLSVDTAPRVVLRPYEPRQVLAQIVELVTAEESESEPIPAHDRQAAELAITAARLACLHRRQATATAAGKNLLAQDLTRQIGEIQALQCGLVAAAPAVR